MKQALVVLGAFLLFSCHHKAKPKIDVAFRFNREDGVTCIIKYPQGPRTINDLKRECGCDKQVCLVKTIHLTNVSTPFKK